MGWTPAERQAAINTGKNGGTLTDEQRKKLDTASKQAGSVGRAARDALDKAEPKS